MTRIVLLLVVILWTGVAISMPLQDPTRPQFSTDNGPEPGQYDLTAIIIAKDRRIAVINGQRLKVGDEFEDAKVVAIDPNTVQLEGSNGKMTLILLKQSIKQETGAS